MGLEDYITENSKWLIPGLLIAVGFYTLGKGQILSRDINEFWVYAALGVVIWVFTLLRKDLSIAENKEKELNERINKLLAKKVDKEPTEGKPFDGKPFDFKGGG